MSQSCFSSAAPAAGKTPVGYRMHAPTRGAGRLFGVFSINIAQYPARMVIVIVSVAVEETKARTFSRGRLLPLSLAVGRQLGHFVCVQGRLYSQSNQG